MNDYSFGEYLFNLRRDACLSQANLADKLGVSDKAVSKWETGKAKPRTDMLKKLAAFFNVPIEDLLQMPKEREEMEISKIVVTGRKDNSDELDTECFYRNGILCFVCAGNSDRVNNRRRDAMDS